MATPINVPFALVPTVELSAYGPKRTFHFVPAAGGSPGNARLKIWGSGDGVNFPPTTATPLLELGGENVPKTIDDLSLRYRAQVAAGAGLVATVDVQIDCCENGGNFLQTAAIPNLPAGGPIGLAPATVDIYEAFQVNQTTAGQAVTLPAPTDPTATHRAYVENVGTVGFDLYGQFLQVGAWAELLWNGTTWTASVGNSDGTISAIGTTGGANGVRLLAGSGDLVGNVDNGGTVQLFTDSGAIQLDTSAGGAIQIGSVVASVKATTIGSAFGASTTTIQSGTGALALESQANINIGVNGVAQTIAIGNLIGATGVGIQTGTAGFAVQTTGAGPIAMSTGTTGTVTIDSGTTGAINIGTNANPKVINIGNGTAGTAVTISSGATIDIGTGAQAQTITIGNATGATSVVVNGGTGPMQFGANATVHTTTIGSVTGASATALRAGTGGLTLVNNGVTWTWPTALGAAGSQLTDAAGNGILSWA